MMMTSKDPIASCKASFSRFSLPTLVARSTSMPDRSRSAGRIQRFWMAMCLGGPRFLSGLWLFQAARIDLVRISGPNVQSSSLSEESPTPLANNSFMVGPTLRLSTPKVVATFPFGSMSTRSTLLRRIPYSLLPIARAEARLTAVVVREQPPLWLTQAMTMATLSNSQCG